MIAGLILFSFLSALYLPWPCTALLALLGGMMEPLVPLAVGIFADMFYYTPALHTAPKFTLYGAIAAGALSFVRSRLRTGMII
ncbi:hypothetical protein KGM48_02440 [Patescibacteria group bacterium]|nr:hypothetical protein [Patescibacteria group bacterium]